MELKIHFDIDSAIEFFGDISEKALKKAIAHASNEAIKEVYKEAQADLKVRYGMPESCLLMPKREEGLPPRGTAMPPKVGGLPPSASYMDLSFLRQKRLNSGGKAELYASRDQISTIHFVLGEKKPQAQKGIRIGDRKPVYISVRPGTKTALKGKFIARPPKTGGTQVFRRGDHHGEALQKDTVPNVYSTITKESTALNFEKKACQAFEKAFEKKLEEELARHI